MMMTLMILAPPLTAIGMMLWLRHARQFGGRRWIGHWLASLLPVGVLLAIAPFAASIPDLVFAVPMVLAAMGAAAFAGGALYLVVSALAASESVQSAGASILEGYREWVNSPGESGDGVMPDWNEPPGGIFNGGPTVHGGGYINGGGYRHGGPYGVGTDD